MRFITLNPDMIMQGSACVVFIRQIKIECQFRRIDPFGRFTGKAGDQFFPVFNVQKRLKPLGMDFQPVPGCIAAVIVADPRAVAKTLVIGTQFIKIVVPRCTVLILLGKFIVADGFTVKHGEYRAAFAVKLHNPTVLVQAVVHGALKHDIMPDVAGILRGRSKIAQFYFFRNGFHIQHILRDSFLRFIDVFFRCETGKRQRTGRISVLIAAGPELDKLILRRKVNDFRFRVQFHLAELALHGHQRRKRHGTQNDDNANRHQHFHKRKTPSCACFCISFVIFHSYHIQIPDFYSHFFPAYNSAMILCLIVRWYLIWDVKPPHVKSEYSRFEMDLQEGHRNFTRLPYITIIYSFIPPYPP